MGNCCNAALRSATLRYRVSVTGSMSFPLLFFAFHVVVCSYKVHLQTFSERKWKPKASKQATHPGIYDACLLQREYMPVAVKGAVRHALGTVILVLLHPLPIAISFFFKLSRFLCRLLWQCRELTADLSKATRGEAFVLMGGDCAESFSEFKVRREAIFGIPWCTPPCPLCFHAPVNTKCLALWPRRPQTNAALSHPLSERFSARPLVGWRYRIDLCLREVEAALLFFGLGATLWGGTRVMLSVPYRTHTSTELGLLAFVSSD